MPREGNHLEDLDTGTLKSAILVLEDIEAADGKNAREELLRVNKDNQALQEILYCSLGTEKYHIRLPDKIDSADKLLNPLLSFKKFLVVLQVLNARKIKSTKEAKAKVTGFLRKCHPRLRKWFQRTINHNLRIGVSGTTVEKVYGTGFWTGAKEGEFHYHGCSLAKKMEDAYPGDKEPEFPVAVEFKLDGERSMPFVFFDDGDNYHVEIYTRGKLRKEQVESVEPLMLQFLGVAEKLAEISGIEDSGGMFLDGEFLATDWNETSSAVGKTVNFDEAAFLEQIKVILFDWAPISAYMAKQFDMPWKKRKQLLMQAAGAKRPFEKVMRIEDNVYVLGHKIVHNMDELEAFHARSLDGGFEGSMIKVLNAPHVFHRKHKCILKLKPEDEETGTITRLVSGEGMHSAASNADRQRVLSLMHDWQGDGTCDGIENDGSYFHAMGIEHPDEAVKELRSIIKDSVDRRVSVHLDDDTVSYRYGERLGFFEVDWNGETIHVGGGLRFKAGQDDRMRFWQAREDLVGTKIDFKVQKDQTDVAKARFNKFVRLREDL